MPAYRERLNSLKKIYEIYPKLNEYVGRQTWRLANAAARKAAQYSSRHSGSDLPLFIGAAAEATQDLSPEAYRQIGGYITTAAATYGSKMAYDTYSKSKDAYGRATKKLKAITHAPTSNALVPHQSTKLLGKGPDPGAVTRTGRTPGRDIPPGKKVAVWVKGEGKRTTGVLPDGRVLYGGPNLPYQTIGHMEFGRKRDGTVGFYLKPKPGMGELIDMNLFNALKKLEAKMNKSIPSAMPMNAKKFMYASDLKGRGKKFLRKFKRALNHKGLAYEYGRVLNGGTITPDVRKVLNQL